MKKVKCLNYKYFIGFSSFRSLVKNYLKINECALKDITEEPIFKILIIEVAIRNLH